VTTTWLLLLAPVMRSLLLFPHPWGLLFTWCGFRLLPLVAHCRRRVLLRWCAIRNRFFSVLTTPLRWLRMLVSRGTNLPWLSHLRCILPTVLCRRWCFMFYPLVQVLADDLVTRLITVTLVPQFMLSLYLRIPVA
jgi:hypothetical protein